MIKPSLELIDENLDEVWKALDSMVQIINQILSGLGYVEGQESTDGQIGTALIPYLQNLIEDKTPQLGGTLDCNGQEIDGIRIALTTIGGAEDTIYQNTSGKPLLVIVTAHLATLGDKYHILIDSFTAPTTVRSAVYMDSNSADADEVFMPVTFLVPVNWYWEVDTPAGGGSPHIEYWSEFTIG